MSFFRQIASNSANLSWSTVEGMSVMKLCRVVKAAIDAYLYLHRVPVFLFFHVLLGGEVLQEVKDEESPLAVIFVPILVILASKASVIVHHFLAVVGGWQRSHS